MFVGHTLVWNIWQISCLWSCNPNRNLWRYQSFSNKTITHKMATADEKPSWRSDLERDGYAVVRGVLDNTEVIKARWDRWPFWLIVIVLWSWLLSFVQGVFFTATGSDIWPFEVEILLRAYFVFKASVQLNEPRPEIHGAYREGFETLVTEFVRKGGRLPPLLLIFFR